MIELDGKGIEKQVIQWTGKVIVAGNSVAMKKLRRLRSILASRSSYGMHEGSATNVGELSRSAVSDNSFILVRGQESPGVLEVVSKEVNE